MKIRRPLRERDDLTTVTQVVDAVGRDRIYEITGKASANVTNWIAAGFFPPTTYVVIKNELRLIGRSAPDRLWRMIKEKRAA